MLLFGLYRTVQLKFRNNCFSIAQEERKWSLEGAGKGFFAYKSTQKLSLWPVGTALREGNKSFDFLGLRDLS